MKKFTKGLITGIGIGAITGIGTSLAMLVIVEKESVRVENEFNENIKKLYDHLNTEDGLKEKKLFKDIVNDITSVKDIRISDAFKNLPKIKDLNNNMKELLKEE